MIFDCSLAGGAESLVAVAGLRLLKVLIFSMLTVLGLVILKGLWLWAL